MYQRPTNAHYAKTTEVFREACTLSKIDPSTRQASKYRMKKGIAYSNRIEARNNLKLKNGK